MTRKYAETLLRKGPEGIRKWNACRARGENIPDLHRVNLRECDLTHAVLSKVNFCEADLRGAILTDAILSGANLVRARLCAADLTKAQLAYSDFCLADLGGAIVTDANFLHAAFHHTLIAGDYSEASGLDSTIHYGPSNITVATILAFKDSLPERFLRGCGVPTSFIEVIRTFLDIAKPIPRHSCFISYDSEDEDFGRKLYQRMKQEHLKVWFGPEDIKSGEKLVEQISAAINEHEKLLIVISEASLNSGWVKTELRKAFKAEKSSGKRKLLPIRLVDIEMIEAWECIDRAAGKI